LSFVFLSTSSSQVRPEQAKPRWLDKYIGVTAGEEAFHRTELRKLTRAACGSRALWTSKRRIYRCRSRTEGLFEEADGGILFLDEIGDIPLTLQNRLLKPIEEKQVKRIGSNQYQTFDVQIIAATSRNLPAMIQQCEFRADLYWRLAVLSIEASPLSTRRQDIPAMIGLFLRQASELISARSYTLPFHVQDAALEVLCNADYPGNIRTLRNLIYTLASRVSDQEPISLELVQSLIAALMKDQEHSDTTNYNRKLATEISKSRLDADLRIDKSADESPVRSYISDGDIMLPLEVRILRRGETFRQWTARAKSCSIEAVRSTTGGTMKAAAERLGLTHGSLKGHLHRAKRAQNELLFDFKKESNY